MIPRRKYFVADINKFADLNFSTNIHNQPSTSKAHICRIYGEKYVDLSVV